MRRRAGAWLALLLAACAPHAPPTLPASPVPAGPAITIEAAPVDEGPTGYTRIRRADSRGGLWTFAGALHLTSPDTSRLHGLSDLDVAPDGRIVAVSDVGDLLTARLITGDHGRILGLAEATLTPLAGLAGEVISGQKTADAEGLALLPGGDRLVSFEHNHRIWLYPAGGGPPRVAPAPAAALPENEGLEALTLTPEHGSDAYLTAAEFSGRTWLCRLVSGCVEGPRAPLDPGFGVVAVRRIGQGRTAWLLRAWDPVRGNRIELRVTGRDGRVLDSYDIARPATVDNFEGLAAIPLPAGRIRFLLVSDDNFAASQHTLLMALDWTPERGR